MSQAFGGLQFNGPIQVGQTWSTFKETAKPVGTYEKVVILGGDSCLISLYAGTVVGTISVTVSTIASDTSKSFEIIKFPTLTTATADLLLKKASATMGIIVIKVVITGGPADFDIDVRALSTADGSTRILGAATAVNYNLVSTSTASVLIPSSNKDRSGLTIKNWGPSGILYLGFSLANTTTLKGYPISYGADFQVDLSAGQAVYAITSGPAVDVRVAEALG
jgi:hypothetical protein